MAQLSYFDIPKRIPKPQIATDTSYIDAMNAYQYKSRFLDSSIKDKIPTVPKDKNDTKVETPKAPINIKTKPMNDAKTIGFDPTDNKTYVQKIDNIEFAKKHKPSGSIQDHIKKLQDEKKTSNIKPMSRSNDYQKILDDIEKDRQQSIINRDIAKTEKTSYDKENTDKYGNPKNTSKSRLHPKPSGKSVGLI
jgi:hypothetical protein